MEFVPVFAQTSGAGGGAGGIVSLIPLILIFVVFYMLLIRPQQKKMKAHRAMVEALKRGDKVVTGGGILGTVTKVINDAELQVELAEGVRVRVLRHTVQEVLAKTEPAEASGGTPANDSSKSEQKSGFSLGGLLGGKSKKD
jgi:preprotein translocase subunit YajC